MMKIIAITDETSTCECCGKTNLKKVIVMQNDNGDIVRYGTDCAAKAQRKSSGTVKREVEAVAYWQKWIAVYPAAPQKVAEGVWNKFGFLFEIKNGCVNFSFGSFKI